MKKSAKPANTEQRPLIVRSVEGEDESMAVARMTVEPFFRHGIVASGIITKMAGTLPGNPQIVDYSETLLSKAKEGRKGNLGLASDLLMAQALSLDAMFTELARRATMNMGDYPEACERYARLAFKAQSNSRAALEALAKLHQPREQTVKHVHVNEGGQAVVADHFHQHRGDQENGNSIKQSDAAGSAGTSAALLGPDTSGNGMPITVSKRQAAMQDARRDEPRCA